MILTLYLVPERRSSTLSLPLLSLLQSLLRNLPLRLLLLSLLYRLAMGSKRRMLWVNVMPVVSLSLNFDR